MARLWRVGLLMGLCAVLTACNPARVLYEWVMPKDDPVVMSVLQTEILAVYRHDSAAFTQGLLWHDGLLYESTGRYGQSTLREVALDSGEVLRDVALDDAYFAEGLERVGDRLWQLTWRENVAFVYDLATFEQVDSFIYEGEGWGICADDSAFYVSDGSAVITLRDLETFEVIDAITVRAEGQEVVMINELECVDESIYANIWQSDVIIRIDKASGHVTGFAPLSGLLSPEAYAALGNDGVLNGIAYNPETETFYITGKLWDSLFEVRFIER